MEINLNFDRLNVKLNPIFHFQCVVGCPVLSSIGGPSFGYVHGKAAVVDVDVDSRQHAEYFLDGLQSTLTL